MKLTIAHLYPDKMNIYGDWGNIVALRKRLEWRGFETEYRAVRIGDKFDFTSADIVFGGGGQDNGQLLVAQDLQRQRRSILKAVENDVVFLSVCGTYQLFGHSFVTADGAELPGIGVFNGDTIASNERLIGNVVIGTQWGEVIGFENHSGKTRLKPGQSALGRVISGYGNNGEDNFEGAVHKNVFGTYLHGPLLPKNPVLADELIKRALANKGESKELEPIDDELESKAAETAKQRPQ